MQTDSPRLRMPHLGRALALAAALGAIALTFTAAAQAATPVFVNELHYDNASTDTGEAIEIAAPMGTDLTGWSVHLYNGNTPGAATTYGSAMPLSGTVGESRVQVIELPENGLQNGSNDGLALVDSGGAVVQLLSYEGEFTAADGPAAGMTSTDIGVEETGSTPAGHSLQLTGDGAVDEDFEWVGPLADSFGELNVGQTFDGASGGDPGGGGPELGECGEDYTEIPAIQGAGAASPLANEGVVTEGVVIGDYQGATGTGALDGYYLQADPGDADPTTSDGVFVYHPAGDEVSAGDRIRVAGTAQETFGQTQIGLVAGSALCSQGYPLPAVTPVTLPDDDPNLESFEGMRVVLPGELTLNESRNLDDFGEVRISVGGRLVTPTEVAEPGPEAVALAEENEARTIILDDGRDGSFQTPIPHLAPGETLRRGDTIADVEGILGFGFSAYRLQPVGPLEFTEGNPRPASPGEVEGDFHVASFNVLNYFTTLGERGASTPAEFEAQEAKIVAAIEALGADVVALEEIESNDGLALDTLVAALNEAAGNERWAGVPVPANFTGTDAITVAFIHRTDRAEAVGEPVAFPHAAFGNARQPIAQSFEVAGERFTAIANHFKSKGCGGSSGTNADQGDGQSCYNADRVEQAEALLEFIDELATDTGDPDVIALGDFNAYSREDPMDTLRAGGLVDLGDEIPAAERYTYVFDGYQGSLDHALATASLAAKVADVAPWHVNADEPDAFQYTGASALYAPDPYRSSDHDPEVIGIGAPPAGGKRPVNLKRPVVKGKPRVGRKLTCRPGRWQGAERFKYRWLRDGKPTKKRNRRYKPLKADRGHMLACRVTAYGEREQGKRPSARAQSKAVGPVKRR